MLIEGNNKNKSKSGHNNKNKDKTFNDFVMDDLIRLGYSYFIFIIFAVMLINFQMEPGSNNSHIYIFSLIYIILTFVMEIIWLFFFTENYRGDNDKNDEDKSLIHRLLNNILPITALIFGYILLIDGFRPGGGSNRVEYLIKAFSITVFFVSYTYLFYELTNIIAIDDKTSKKVKGALNSKVNDKNKTQLTYYDFLIDILYNLFQPVSILFISLILYCIIKMIYSSGGTPSVPSMSESMPSAPPADIPPPPQ